MPPVTTPQPMLDALAALDAAKVDDIAKATAKGATAAALSDAQTADTHAQTDLTAADQGLAAAKKAAHDAIDANY